MTPQEASEIIAKFMGYKKLDTPTRTSRSAIRWVKGKKRMSSLDFHRSLDALVSVWEKLAKKPICISQGINQCEGKWFVQHGLFDGGERETIQEAAAIATAKAIQELGK